MSWTSILLLAAGAYFFKAAGVALGRLSAGDGADGPVAERSGAVARIGRLLPPALLSALVVSQTVGSGTELTVDARLPGVAVGTVAALLRAPFWLTVLLAALTTATIRLVSG